MPRIHKPANALHEIVERRTHNSKLFQLANGDHKLVVSCGLAHYADENGKLQDIEHEFRLDASSGEVVADKLPFKLRLLKRGIGFTYHSRTAGMIRQELTSVGDVAIDSKRLYVHSRDGRAVTFTDVATDTDIVIKVSSRGVQIVRRLKSAMAAKSWTWDITYDAVGKTKLSTKIIGVDANGSALSGLSIVNGAETAAGPHSKYAVRETWDGSYVAVDRTTRVKSISKEPSYPVEIDPDIVENPATDNDDGASLRRPAWYNDRDYIGHNVYEIGDAGWRFVAVNVSQGATIALAELKLHVTGRGNAGEGYAGGTIYGYDTDDAGAWGGAIIPAAMVNATKPKTSASTPLPRPTGAGVIAYDVTAIIQEIVNRPGFTSGNAISLAGLTYDGATGFIVTTIFEDTHAAGLYPPQLEITLAGGGGGGGNSSSASSASSAGILPATAYSVTGPSSGPVDTDSGVFTFMPNGDADGKTVTPGTNGDGVWIPSTVTFVADTPETAVYHPNSTTGVDHALSFTNDGDLIDQGDLDYTVTAGGVFGGGSVIGTHPLITIANS